MSTAVPSVDFFIDKYKGLQGRKTSLPGASSIGYPAHIAPIWFATIRTVRTLRRAKTMLAILVPDTYRLVHLGRTEYVQQE